MNRVEMERAGETSPGAETRRILIVDDESSIRRTLEGVFLDEGFVVGVAEDGASALRMISDQAFSVVLLDIWMPGSDGLEILRKMRQLQPDVPVIMMSGHATIATAVKATHLGAFDFVEKPLDLEATLRAVKRALSRDRSESPEVLPEEVVHEDMPAATMSVDRLPALNRLVFSTQRSRGRKIPQRTLAHSAVLYGQGLHSGRKSGLSLEPLPAGSGIHFVGVSESTPVPAHLDFVDSTGFATTVKLGGTQAGTIEHLMSVLNAYGIANLLVKCNGEVPVLDGSARQFCALFDEVGLVEQPGDWYAIRISEKIRVGNEREWIQIEPHDGFVIDYILEYGHPVGRQEFRFALNDVEAYKQHIAPARTFGFVKDIGMLQKQGLALGGRFDNFVLFSEDGAINTALRFQDEPVRHKILDAIGDLYLLGRPLEGKVTACMTGHSDNVALLRAIQSRVE